MASAQLDIINSQKVDAKVCLQCILQIHKKRQANYRTYFELSFSIHLGRISSMFGSIRRSILNIVICSILLQHSF